MSAPYTAVYKKDGPWIMGQLLELPGVLTQGRTVEECRDNLRDALGEYIRARRDLAEGQRQGELLREPMALEPA